MRQQRLQAGLSLIELMVAMALSSFLILGIVQIYIDNKRSYSFQQSQSENLEGSRYALLLLQQELSKAGYRRRPDEPFDFAFPALSGNVAGCGDFEAGTAAKRISQNEICIRYQPRDQIDRDCLGDLPVTASALESGPYTSPQEIIIERLWFEEGDGTTPGRLNCTRVHTNMTGTVTATVSSGELIAGIVDLRFELGTGSSADPRSVSQYTIDDTSDPILAIRYVALLRSSGGSLRDSISAADALKNWQTITGLDDSDSKLSALKNDDKGQLYQVSQSSVTLRNLMP